MTKTENVVQAYASDSGLAARLNLHDVYSTNKQGLFPFLFEQYHFFEGCRILELGCGNGQQWQGRIGQLPQGCELTLSDFSCGMVDVLRGKYSAFEQVKVDKIDIQHIDHPDESFDIVIANHMLYHVPDLAKGIGEMSRVLKKGGMCYTSTNGTGGMHGYLREAVLAVAPDSDAFSEVFSFNLQNGAQWLSPYFAKVVRVDYIDSLAVTRLDDLMAWLRSAVSIATLSETDIVLLQRHFESIMREQGVITIPKECGLFISTK